MAVPKKSSYDLPSDDLPSVVRGLEGNGYTKTLLCFLSKCDLGRTISRYMVLIATEQKLMIMRPYQVYAVQHMVKCIDDDDGNAFVWHTTGSGKTLTSFKASTLLKENDSIHKCVFVVDRKDLDRQTREEFNRFQEGCIEEKRTVLSRQRRRGFKARLFYQDCDREISDTLRWTKPRQSSLRLAIHAKL